MKRAVFFILFSTVLICQSVFSEGLKSVRLKNGFTVFIWEDSTKNEVFGSIVVKAGSANDPEKYTGLAHYLEHVMFKGTERIGALDWAKEKPIYENIVTKYDERAAIEDQEKRSKIDKEINNLSVEQSSISISNEFSTLIESIGGTGLNAGTSFDRTLFFNSFPAFQLEKWLEIYSSRFINPVFRTFQAELENVYEEFNMYSDSKSSQLSDKLFSTIFENHPYGRPIIGYGEHLKNPQLSKLVGFYRKYYVPENMALILVGNVKAEDILKTISRKFSRLQNGSESITTPVILPELKGYKSVSISLGDYPEMVLAFNGVPENHEDKIKLQVCIELLSNSNKTGLLDKLSLDGDLMYSSASQISLASGGRILLTGIPAYDMAQKRYESNKSVEKMLSDIVNRLKSGEYESWLLQSVKENICRRNDMSFESSQSVGNILSSAFVSDVDLNNVLKYDSIVQSVSADDINMLAKKYFSDDKLAISIIEGKSTKKDKMPVADKIKPVESTLGKVSDYKTWFETIPVGNVKEDFENFDDVKVAKINDLSRLYYRHNNINEYFSLTIKYGAGERAFPKLGLSAMLMNNAGVMAALDAQEFKRELSILNSNCSYSSDDDYLYVRISGVDRNLKDICNLVTRQILMPKPDEKQINNVKSQLLQSRFSENENTDVVKDALMQYMIYGTSSDYIKRLKEEEIIYSDFAELKTTFQKATGYEAEVHYAGALPFDEVKEILSANLPLKFGELASESPKDKTLQKLTENTVYYIQNKDLRQSEILIYLNGPQFTPEKAAGINVFNQYFDGGFGGLVINEIREKNSMAYHASGKLYNPKKKESDTYFFGQVGTQNDKTVDALTLYSKLLSDMPLVPERMNTIKDYLYKSLLSDKTNFRSSSQTYNAYKLLGFDIDPAKFVLPIIKEMSFDDLKAFYEASIKGKPVSIGIVGNLSSEDVKKLETFGKVKKLSVTDIFK
jgi:predicted Zn-dependent peptidase